VQAGLSSCSNSATNSDFVSQGGEAFGSRFYDSRAASVGRRTIPRLQTPNVGSSLGQASLLPHIKIWMREEKGVSNVTEGTDPEKDRAMSTDNKDLVRRMYEEVWNKRNLEVAKELISPSHAMQLIDLPDAGIGPEAYARNVVQFVRAFPDLEFKVLDMVGENEKVVALWNISGTHKGEFRGIAPTGKKVSVDGITISQLAGGKIIDSYVSLDLWGMMQQLGVIPATGQAQKTSSTKK
jgi:steroid delta-isomerase-like uncharacterized protein